MKPIVLKESGQQSLSQEPDKKDLYNQPHYCNPEHGQDRRLNNNGGQ
jgi:hypothetical protein